MRGLNDLNREHDQKLREQKAKKHIPETVDVVDLIIAYESGELTEHNTLKMFAELVRTGQAWTLQGHYGRTAKQLIDVGLIDDKGNINEELYFEMKSS